MVSIKKPYKIKFDKKIDLFGNGSSKKWVLLANHYDVSMIRNYLAFGIGEEIGADYVSKSQFVDLYLNGEYQGVYQVCEQNEVGTNRVELDKSFDDDNDVSFLIELDNKAPNFYAIERSFDLKFPEDDTVYFEKYSETIKKYLEQAYDAMISKDIDLISQFIDIDSFVRNYIVHELFNNVDIGNSSFYMYRPKGGKLSFGPLWDFDVSSGNCDYVDLSYDRMIFNFNFIYELLLDVDYIKNAVALKLSNDYITISDSINTLCDNIYNFKNSMNRNFEKWKVLGTSIWPNPEELIKIKTWEGHVEYLREYLMKSLDYVYNYYVDAESSAYSISFSSDALVYNSEESKYGTIVLNNAWSRNLQTSELLNDGTGGIIFKVLLDEGYVVDIITINDNTLYDELVVVDEINHICRINGIKGNIIVNITQKEYEEEPNGYGITFTTPEDVSIMIYPGKDYTVDGTITKTTLVEDMSGDGQLNFKVIVPNGYVVDSININGTYKNLKDSSETLVDNVYRITKVSSNLEITITTKLAS